MKMMASSEPIAVSLQKIWDIRVHLPPSGDRDLLLARLRRSGLKPLRARRSQPEQ
jgi:hypothetical protein